MNKNAVTWNHVGEVVQLQNKLNGTIAGIKALLEEFDRIKKDIIDNPTLKANLKEALAIHPTITIESIVADYQKIKALQQLMIDEGLLE